MIVLLRPDTINLLFLHPRGGSFMNSAAGAGIGGIVGAAIVANNPELAPFTIPIVAVAAGIMGGVGNIARDSANRFVSTFFGWLG